MYWKGSRSEVYLREDLLAYLRGIYRAGIGPRHRGMTLRQQDYREGFLAALEAMALALGADPVIDAVDYGEGQRIPVRNRLRDSER
jgi:hypothetical protein